MRLIHLNSAGFSRLVLFLVIAALLILAGIVTFIALDQGQIDKEEAREIALKTPEMRAFMGLMKGREFCVDLQVVKPCDSKWVTCIEDAWVFKAEVKNECVKHDGRLIENLLIHNKTGRVISRFPEMFYFQNSSYCHDDYDCLGVVHDPSEPPECMNFVYSQISSGVIYPAIQCQCRDNACRMK